VLAGVVEVLLASLALACLLIVVGVAARVLLGGRLDLPRSVAVSAGIGASVIAVVVALSYRLTGTSVTVLRVLVVAAAVVVVVGAARAVRRSTDRRALLRGWASHLVNPADSLGAALAILLMSRLLPLGLTFWTSGPNDWHRYVASVQVWLSGEAGEPDFSAVHSGDFRDTQLDRALSEKPLATALLLAATRTTGVADFRLLTPVTLVLLWIAFAAAAHLLSRRLGLSPWLAVPVVAATTGSLLPMWPAYAAQVGHLVVATGALVWLCVLAGTRRDAVGTYLVGGVVVAWTAGSNISVAGGLLLVLLALGVWVQGPDRPVRAALRDVVGTGVVAALLLAPFATWFVHAISVQAAGTEGSTIPLASPVGFVGLQVTLLSSEPLTQALVAWGLVVVVAVALTRPPRTWSSTGRRAAASAAAVAATLIGLATAFGPDNYVVAKTTMLVVAIAMPLALGAAVVAALDGLPGHRWRVVAAVTVLGVAAAVIAWRDSEPATAGARAELGALADDERLRELDLVTIDIDDYAANSMASVIVPAARVVVARATYAHADPPEGDLVITSRRQAALARSEVVADLPGDYVLVRRDLSLAAGVYDVGRSPAAAEHLYGFWINEPGPRTWTTATVNWFVGDLDPELRDRDLLLTFTGLAVEPGEPAREIVATVDGVEVGRARVRAGATSALEARIAASAVPEDGRLEVRLTSAGPLHPWEVATREYALETVVVRVG
jgi:hypothetical protein